MREMFQVLRPGGRLLIADSGRPGDAARAVPVLRKAVDRMTRALMHVDDSSRIVGDDLHATMRLYSRACTASPPKPASIASWLVGLVCDAPGYLRADWM